MVFLSKRSQSLTEAINSTVFSVDELTLSSDEAFKSILNYLNRAKANHNKVFVIGNGGSAGIASHHVVDLINVLKVPATTVSDNNLVTCMANDFGYETCFARPLDVLANEGDVLIAISSSGRSQNILDATEVLRRKGGCVITLSGFLEDNPLRALGDINIWTPVEDYGLVESAHFFILHTLVDGASYFSNLTQLIETKQKSIL